MSDEKVPETAGLECTCLTARFEDPPCPEHGPKGPMRCRLCGGPRAAFQVFCGAACSAEWEMGKRPAHRDVKPGNAPPPPADQTTQERTDGAAGRGRSSGRTNSLADRGSWESAVSPPPAAESVQLSSGPNMPPLLAAAHRLCFSSQYHYRDGWTLDAGDVAALKSAVANIVEPPPPASHAHETSPADLAGRAERFLAVVDRNFSGVLLPQHLAALLRDVAAEAEARGRAEERERTADVLARLDEWGRTYGAALKPTGADTFGEGMREAKRQVMTILLGRRTERPHREDSTKGERK